MKYGIYEELSIADDFSVIDFASEGKNGIIFKRITFTATGFKNVYNLAFGDIDKDGKLNDRIVSDNGDRNKVLATIVKVVYDYLNNYPNRLIYFEGSTKERTRLYRMAVGINLEELCTIFDIYGYVRAELKVFSKNMEVNGFLIKRKFL